MSDRVIMYDEWALDNGKVFQTTYDYDIPTAGGSVYFLFVVPSTGSIHVSSKYMVMGGTVTVELYRNPTVSANGTVPLVACLLDNAKLPTLQVFANPTVTANGTLFRQFRIMAGTTGATDLPSTISPTNHRVLQGGASYLVKLTSTANNTMAQVGFEWVEM